VVGLSSCEREAQSNENEVQSSSLASNTQIDTPTVDEMQASSSNDDSVPDLKNLSQAHSRFALKIKLYDLVAESNQKQVITFLEQSREITRDSIRESIQEIIIERLAVLNPKEALAQVTKLREDVDQYLTKMVFEEWSISDLESAISHAETLEGLRKVAALQGILRSRDDLNEGRRMEIAKALGLEQYALDITTHKDKLASFESPEMAWSALVNDTRQDLTQIKSLIQVAEAWIEREGLDALEKIQASITDPKIGRPVLTAVLHEIALRAPQATFDKALELDGDLGNFYGTGNYAITSVVQSWATAEPQAAFDHVASLEPSALRSHLQNSIIQSWGESNPQDLLANIDVLPGSVQVFGTETAIVSLARSAPKEAASLLSSVKLGNRLIPAAYSLVSSWSDQDADAALDWVKTNPSVEVALSELLPVVLGNLAKSDSERAMKIALQQPVEENRVSMEVSVITHLANSDPQQAASLLNQVREGTGKLSAYTSVGTKLIRDGDIQYAEKLAGNLTESERNTYYESIVDTWAMTRPEDLFHSLSSLPSKTIQSRAARGVLGANQLLRRLSDDEIESMIVDYLED